MGGVDAAGGFAFQHAQAVLGVLGMAADPRLGQARVEADNDVVDLEILDSSGLLVRALQFKRRDQRYTWAQTDLMEELERWSKLGPEHPEAEYRFVTDGRLGPTGRKVLIALDELRNGDERRLTAIASGLELSVDLNACRRAFIDANAEGFDTLLDEAVRLATNLLPAVTGEAEAEERSMYVVLELLRLVVGRSGLSEVDRRVVTSADVWSILNENREYVRTNTWNIKARSDYIRAVAEIKVPSIELRCKTDHHTRLPLAHFLGGKSVVLLHGSSGTGKTTAILGAQVASVAENRAIIRVDAKAYVAGRIGSLIAKGINSPQFVGAYSATGLEALKDPYVTVVVDNLSEIPVKLRRRLAEDLRELLMSDLRASLALVGRDLVALRSVLPRDQETSLLTLESLTRDSRRAIVREIIDEPECNILAAQAEHAIGDAADNPQLFLVACRLVAQGFDFQNPASMYSAYIRRIAEDQGYEQVSVYEIGLGVIFACLAAEGRRYADSFEWAQLAKKSADILSEAGQDVDGRDIVDFGLDSGLVRRSGGDITEAIHDSFADYLAAIAYARKCAEFPRVIASDDHLRLLFYSEISGVDLTLAHAVAAYRPFSVPVVSLREGRKPTESWYTESVELVSRLLPEGVNIPRLAMWEFGDKLMVTVDGSIEGWRGEVSLDSVDLDEGVTFEAEHGPLTIASRVWRRYLLSILKSPVRNRFASLGAIASDPEGFLEWYSIELDNAKRRLLDKILPADGRISYVDSFQLGSIQFNLEKSVESIPPLERGVRYRFVADSMAPRVVCCNGEGLADGWTGQASIESFSRGTPQSDAAEDLLKEINELVGIKWL
ncbi:hypothetical protein NWF34_21455 [Gordonia sp. GONU]|uniref:Uncharacterized protein n=1 Tax=Gordonia amicalis TaxID=89053 RepID=A0AAE4R9Y2_9ACTN|nr:MULTISPECIES: hypothetical protein [Gordonia]MCR8899508.1 hypothetical protein [Gordonia sp. GONU]MCZ4652219.1 hypothetical protein [Gordonia amicalis]MDV6314278.1 hypothetical protein [Gordonia amicalis]